MPRVLIQPAAGTAARAHFVDTVQAAVPVSRIRGYLTGADLPSAVAALAAVPVWGVTPGQRGQNAKAWSSVMPGDVVLFYGQKRFFASAVVLGKVHSADLAEALWGLDPSGVTWEHVYFLDEITEREIPVVEFNRAMGYQENNVPQGFQVVSGDRAEDLLALFELESGATPPDVTPGEYEEVLSLPAGPLDRQTSGHQRVEQRFLRQHLFAGRRTRGCCICGRDLPTELLVAAHIKRRSECSPDEKRDYRNIVAPMCRLGCDALYELHYIVVDDTGAIRRDDGMPVTPELEAFVSPLVGRQCAAWNEGTRGYFQWHADHRRNLVR